MLCFVIVESYCSVLFLYNFRPQSDSDQQGNSDRSKLLKFEKDQSLWSYVFNYKNKHPTEHTEKLTAYLVFIFCKYFTVPEGCVLCVKIENVAEILIIISIVCVN